jgi:hypothetical protein
MHCEPIILSPLINGVIFAKTIVNSSCLCYRLCDPAFAAKLDLRRTKITLFYIEAFNGEPAREPI